MSQDFKTVVYLDMARYSAISRSLEKLHGLGAGATAKLNAQVHGFVRQAVADVGVVLDEVFVKDTGDGAILVFPEPAPADRFASAFHRRAAEHNRPTSHENERRLFRVGICSGELRRTAAGDVAGTVIGNAARLEAAAKTGEVLIDAESWEGLPEEQQRAYGPVELVQGKVHDPEFRVRRRRVTVHSRAPEPPESRNVDPAFRNPEARRLSTRLEDLYDQRDRLKTSDEDTRTLDGQIRDVRRLLRKGPLLQPGEILLDGRFLLVETLGQGGFATVWKALDRQLKHPVAVKVLHGQYSEDRTRRERFFRGARKMAELPHPNIVRVIEPYCEDRGWYFFVMEIVAGGDFNQAVLGGELTDDEKLEIVLKVGETLEYAHQRGVIHRDVKPSNIVLDEGRRPKLTDFDLVLTDDSTGLTRTRAMLGTLRYAAPEALESAKDVGPPADVYSLASTAIFALLGEPLPLGYYRKPESAIERLECPPALARVLTRATAEDPKRRFASAAAFVSALEEAVKPPPKPRFVRWVGFGVAVIMMVVTVWWGETSDWWKDARPTGNPGELEFAMPSHQVNESAGAARVAVRRGEGSYGAVSVQCNTAGGTADAGNDYIVTADTLNWTDGDTSDKLCTVPVTDDNNEEDNETINLSLSNFTGGADPGSQAGATLTILNDDDAGELSFTKANYPEAENIGIAEIVVSRTGGSDGVVSALCATASGTADAGNDYIVTTDTLEWADGDASDKLCTIPVTDDNNEEDNETIELLLSNLTGGADPGSQAVAALTIINDDDAGELSFIWSNYPVDEDGGFARIAVSRTSGSDGAVSVRCNTAGGTADAGKDYIATSATLEWAGGDTSDKNCTIPVADDNQEEDNETIYLALTGFVGGADPGSPTTAIITIIANDASDGLHKVVGLRDNISIVEAPGSSNVLAEMELLKPYFVLADKGDSYEISSHQGVGGIQGFVLKREVATWNTREGLRLVDDQRATVATWQSEEIIRQYAGTGNDEANGPTFGETTVVIPRNQGIVPFPLLDTKDIDARGGKTRRIHQILIPEKVDGGTLPPAELIKVSNAVTFCVVFEPTKTMARYAKVATDTIYKALNELDIDTRLATAGFVLVQDATDTNRRFEIVHPMPLSEAAVWLRERPQSVLADGEQTAPILDSMIVAQNDFPWDVGARRIAIVVAGGAAKLETDASDNRVPAGLTAYDVGERLIRDRISVQAFSVRDDSAKSLVEVLSILVARTGGDYYLDLADSIDGNGEFSKKVKTILNTSIERVDTTIQRLRPSSQEAGEFVIMKAWVFEEPGKYRKEILVEGEILEWLVDFFNIVTDSGLEATSLRESTENLLETLAGRRISGTVEVKKLLEDRLGIHFATNLLGFNLDLLEMLNSKRRTLLQRRIRDETTGLSAFCDNNTACFGKERYIWIPMSYLP